MRLSRFLFLAAGVAALGACNESDVSSPDRPPLAGVRLINALADTSSVDVVMIDQVEWSLLARNVNFRAGTEHQPIEAKARRIRVFAFNTANPSINNVSQVLHDTTITFTADSKVTLLLTGSARSRAVRFVVVNDDPPAAATGQIAVRTVNASSGAIDAYYVNAVGDAIAGTPGASNVAPLSASTYVTRSTGNAAARVTDRGATTANASLAGPNAPTGPTGVAAAAGVNSAGSAFSVYYFPRGVAGSPQNAVATPGIVWFVDRVPTP